MKRILTIFIACLCLVAVKAQIPQKMSYQAVIRDANDELVRNTGIGMQISILQGADPATASAVYVERQSPVSNSNGLVSIIIGGEDATVLSGVFSEIDWSAETHFIKSETDLNGGSNYHITGTSQLLSVPFALYAREVENKDDADADPSNELQDLSMLALKSNVLELDNTSRFTPKSDYQPATKAYVDDAVDSRKHYLGESYGGGYVFWVDETGEHGLIAWPGDLHVAGDKSFKWSPDSKFIGLRRDGIGAGRYNTDQIISIHGGGRYAAYTMHNTTNPIGGYGDWYLPSKYELNLLYENRDAAHMSDRSYWSSNQKDMENAWYQNFSTGEQVAGLKGIETGIYVRPIRDF